jgi:hypothetical protein
MKIELVSVIEDEVQKCINKYLRCEDIGVNKKESSKNYLSLLNKCILLLDKENPRYDEIVAKRNFFNARYEYQCDNVKNYPLLIDELKIS